MLLFFRLYKRRSTESKITEAGDSPFEFEDAILHLTEKEKSRYCIYNLEIMSPICHADKDNVNQRYTVSPMNLEFSVFVSPKNRLNKATLCWFSLIELWNLLQNKQDDTKKEVSVDDRMSGHFMLFQNLLASFGMQRITEERSGIFWWKSQPKNSEQIHESWPIEMDTIFVSDVALWHFIFSSKYTTRAMFVARILCQHVYPIIKDVLTTPVVHFAYSPLNYPYQNNRQTRWQILCSWLLSRVPSIHKYFLNRHDHKKNEDQKKNEIIYKSDMRYTYPFLMRYCKYLKRQIGRLEQQLIEAQKHLDSCHQYKNEDFLSKSQTLAESCSQYSEDDHACENISGSITNLVVLIEPNPKDGLRMETIV